MAVDKVGDTYQQIVLCVNAVCPEAKIVVLNCFVWMYIFAPRSAKAKSSAKNVQGNWSGVQKDEVSPHVVGIDVESDRQSLFLSDRGNGHSTDSSRFSASTETTPNSKSVTSLSSKSTDQGSTGKKKKGYWYNVSTTRPVEGKALCFPSVCSFAKV